LRASLRGTRAHLGLSRRKRKIPSRLWAEVTQDGKQVFHSFALSEHPTMLMLPFFAAPVLLGGVGGISGVWLYKFNFDWPKLRRKKITNIATVMDAYRFGQMLAKIGHAYATAELGLNAFTPLLLGFIKDGPSEPFRFVGGSRIIMPRTRSLHTLEQSTLARDRSKYVVVAIRLFARYGGPLYHVVTGVLEPTTDAVS
jgi:hypothetical protein